MCSACFGFGSVIYPLSFLPLHVGSDLDISVGAFFEILFSIRGLILALLTLTFTLVLVVFLVINHKLKYDKKKIANLKLQSQIENYSKYYKAMVENLNRKASDTPQDSASETESQPAAPAVSADAPPLAP